MKVSPKPIESQKVARPSQDEIKAKIKAKFGKDLDDKPVAKEADTRVELSSNAKSKGVSNNSEEGFGDIKNNDPKSPETQEKLKSLLKTGGFNFSDKERQVLSQILK